MHLAGYDVLYDSGTLDARNSLQGGCRYSYVAHAYTPFIDHHTATPIQGANDAPTLAPTYAPTSSIYAVQRLERVDGGCAWEITTNYTCSAGFEPVLDNAGCTTAASLFGKHLDPVTGSVDNAKYPIGCFESVSLSTTPHRSGNLYVNQKTSYDALVGLAQPRGYAVCRQCSTGTGRRLLTSLISSPWAANDVHSMNEGRLTAPIYKLYWGYASTRCAYLLFQCQPSRQNSIDVWVAPSAYSNGVASFYDLYTPCSGQTNYLNNTFFNIQRTNHIMQTAFTEAEQLAWNIEDGFLSTTSQTREQLALPPFADKQYLSVDVGNNLEGLPRNDLGVTFSDGSKCTARCFSASHSQVGCVARKHQRIRQACRPR